MTGGRHPSDARARLRAAVLDAAYDAAVTDSWGAVRMGRLANQVGVSRQTLHNTFGTKQDLARALVQREAESFLHQVLAVLEHGEPRQALRDACAYALRALPEHPLLQAALDRRSDLLPELTIRSGPLLRQASRTLGAALLRRRPDADPARAALMMDALVRLVVSYSLSPDDAPGPTAQRLAALFEAGLAAEG